MSLMDYDLGNFDDETCRLEAIENPFAAKVLPMAPAGMKCYLCARNGPEADGAPGAFAKGSPSGPRVRLPKGNRDKVESRFSGIAA